MRWDREHAAHVPGLEPELPGVSGAIDSVVGISIYGGSIHEN